MEGAYILKAYILKGNNPHHRSILLLHDGVKTMPSHLKLFIHDVPVEICTSVRTGLPFVTTRYIEILIKSILAHAQTFYPVTICHYVVMINHIHIILIVKNPEDVPRFMDYFKAEVAHAMNRLMGTTGQTFWEDGYDSPLILSAKKFLDRMEYLYLNPTAAYASTSIRDYKGLSSYEALIRGDTRETYKKLSRTAYSELPQGKLSKHLEERVVERLLNAKGVKNDLVIEPWAWLKCYEESKDWNPDEIRDSFIKRLSEAEAQLDVKTPFPSNTDIRTPFRSKRNGKKTICLSDCPVQRKSKIKMIQHLSALARECFRRRRAGDSSAAPPPGFFLPGGALLANIAFSSIFLV